MFAGRRVSQNRRTRTFFLLSPSLSTSPMIFSLCPHPYMPEVSQQVQPCPRTVAVSTLTREASTRDGQSRWPCAAWLWTLRRSSGRRRPTCLRARVRCGCQSMQGESGGERGGGPIAPKPGTGTAVSASMWTAFAMVDCALAARERARTRGESAFAEWRRAEPRTSGDDGGDSQRRRRGQSHRAFASQEW